MEQCLSLPNVHYFPYHCTLSSTRFHSVTFNKCWPPPSKLISQSTIQKTLGKKKKKHWKVLPKVWFPLCFKVSPGKSHSMISLNSLLTTRWELLHPEEKGPLVSPHPTGVVGLFPSSAASFPTHLLSVYPLAAPGM